MLRVDGVARVSDVAGARDGGEIAGGHDGQSDPRSFACHIQDTLPA
jgi:hypothetical protein